METETIEEVIKKSAPIRTMRNLREPKELPPGMAVTLMDRGWLLLFNEEGRLKSYIPPTIAEEIRNLSKT